MLLVYIHVYAYLYYVSDTWLDSCFFWCQSALLERHYRAHFTFSQPRSIPSICLFLTWMSCFHCLPSAGIGRTGTIIVIDILIDIINRQGRAIVSHTSAISFVAFALMECCTACSSSSLSWERCSVALRLSYPPSRSLIAVVLVACTGQLSHYIPHQICINRSFVSD